MNHRHVQRQFVLIEADFATLQRYAAFKGHDAPTIEHFSPSFFVFFQQLRQVRVVVAGSSPSQNTCQIVSGSQWQHTDLALLLSQRKMSKFLSFPNFYISPHFFQPSNQIFFSHAFQRLKLLHYGNNYERIFACCCC